MPGLSPGSVAVIQPETQGMSYNQLCSHLVETAKCHGLIENQKDAQQSSKDAA